MKILDKMFAPENFGLTLKAIMVILAAFVAALLGAFAYHNDVGAARAVVAGLVSFFFLVPMFILALYFVADGELLLYD